MIFPKAIMDRPCGYVNLNLAAREWLREHNCLPEPPRILPGRPRKHPREPDKPNPLLDPETAMSMVWGFHHQCGLSWSYGGWLEARLDMHRGTYLEKDELWLHIGLDVNVLDQTEVRALADGPILYVGDDSPLVGGWGGHVIQMITYRGNPHVLLYAHLGDIICKSGTTVSKGDVIGCVGTPQQNGYWFPHVHLQLFDWQYQQARDWQKFSDDMDGYTRLDNRVKWSHLCPDPTPLIFA